MKRQLVLLTVMVVTAAGCGRGVRICECNVETPTLVSDSAVPAVAIYRVPAGNRIGTTPEEAEPQIVLIVWPDGRVVWSEDSQRGGRPYLAGRILPKKLKAFFASLRAQGVSEEALPRRSWFGPDSDYLAIVLCDGPYRVRLESWHELFETDENLVATSSGLRTLGGQSRSEVLAEQPEDYRRFRETWTLIREASRQLIPDEGEPAESLHFAVRQ